MIVETYLDFMNSCENCLKNGGHDEKKIIENAQEAYTAAIQLVNPISDCFEKHALLGKLTQQWAAFLSHNKNYQAAIELYKQIIQILA